MRHLGPEIFALALVTPAWALRLVIRNAVRDARLVRAARR